jgi:miniconductance mechanosensitive channel
MNVLKAWLTRTGLNETQSALAASVVAAIVLVIACVILDFVVKNVLLRIVRTMARRSKTTWDDALDESGLFTRLAHLAPAILLRSAGPVVFADYPAMVDLVRIGTDVWMIVIALVSIDALLTAFRTVWQGFEISKRIQINTVVQLAKVLVYFVGGVAILAIVVGKSPVVFFSGLGAFSAVLMLIFKDAILGFVAGVQLQANKLVRPGDWIEMPKYGVDGDVLEVNLTTVKVQNWDKTILSVPTYALVSDAFKNWRGMQESGGRRIKRSIHVDLNSIRFCDEEMLERFKRVQYITEYVNRKLEEVAVFNQEMKADTSLLVNGRHLTNVGTFRAYLEAYLRNHPKIHQDLTFLIRQLQPTEHGLPIEIYVFTNDTNWVRYEAIQADIFDHLLAALPLFDLRAFQAPAGADLRVLKAAAL